ncbi:hypothetical protein [Flavobacterium sp. N3904]|uniref:hypothetical protein n=1 Tax=Flavobacterium sp. N3904 TaxID=2986835 RepID=UPI0022250795|nr:hypothetical protein [Flavobacterium sp. N3904]
MQQQGIIITLLLIFITVKSFSQNNKETQLYLDDLSDLTNINHQGLALQLGTNVTWFKTGEEKNTQFAVPSFLVRYAFDSHFEIQGQTSLNITKVKSNTFSESNTEINPYTFGALYQFNPDFKILILDQFTVNYYFTAFFDDPNEYISEIDLNFSTKINEKAEIDYSIDYLNYYHSTDLFVLSLELDYYLSPKTLIEISINGQKTLAYFKESLDTFTAIDLTFLSNRKHQFNINYIRDFTQKSNYIGLLYTKVF